MKFKNIFFFISLDIPVCNTANHGYLNTITCPEGYQISKINFASYGTPLGDCHAGGSDSGVIRDISGRIIGDTTNPYGIFFFFNLH